MSDRTLQGNFLFKRATTAAVDTYVAEEGELVLDTRASDLVVRAGDGVTAGGKSVPVKQIASIRAPGVIAPVNGATEVSQSPILTCDGFSGIRADLVSDTHQATYWELATDSDFTNIVYQSGRDTVNLTSIDLDAVNVELSANTRHYFRVKHEGSNGAESQWSPSVYFTTSLIAMTGASVGVIYKYNEHIAAGAISGDGLTVATGRANVGKVVVEEKINGSWVTQATLDDPVASNNNLSFGVSVTLSEDGNTLVVGSSEVDGGYVREGEAYVYSRPGGIGTNWSLTATISNPVPQQNGRFGSGVDISADGNTVAISATGNTNVGGEKGQVYIFNNSGGTWSQTYMATGGAYSLSADIALSGDGSTLVVCDPNYYQYRGRAWVHTLDGGTWSEFDILLGKSNYNYMGRAVDISHDGSVIAIANSGSVSGAQRSGSFLIFTKDLTEYNFTTEHPGPSSTRSIDDQFGDDISISADGNVVAVGAREADSMGYSNNGLAFVYAKNGSGYIHALNLVDDTSNNGKYFGGVIAISSDGKTAVSCGNTGGSIFN